MSAEGKHSASQESEFQGIEIIRENPQSLFQIAGVIGRGAFGAVCKAKNVKTGEILAVKMLPFNSLDETIDDVRREISILKECDHPNIVRYEGTYMDRDTLWITMEYCAGTSVEQVFTLLNRPLKENEIAAVCKETLKALVYLHDLPALHRDIKCGNILFTDDGGVRIADFGVSAKLVSRMTRRNSCVGTPYWMAPEVILERDYDGRADVWSLGITAIEMADMKPPLSSIHPLRAMFAIPRNPPPTLKSPELWSPEFSDFLEQSLAVNMNRRATSRQMLEHPFVANADTSCLKDLVQEYYAKMKEEEENTKHNIRHIDSTSSFDDLEKAYGDPADPEGVGSDLGTIIEHDEEDCGSVVDAASSHDSAMVIDGIPGPHAYTTDAVPIPHISLDSLPLSILCGGPCHTVLKQSVSREYNILNVPAAAALLGCEGPVDTYPSMNTDVQLTPTLCSLLKCFEHHQKLELDLTDSHVLTQKLQHQNKQCVQNLGSTLRSILKL
eukprot:PhF_6_TR12323/c0_g1_i1/m.19578/K04411/STK4, MST1; serine/threonine kinase 4